MDDGVIMDIGTFKYGALTEQVNSLATRDD